MRTTGATGIVILVTVFFGGHDHVGRYLGDDLHYRLHKITSRHFSQTGRAAGFHHNVIDAVFADIVTQVRPALARTGRTAGTAEIPKERTKPS